MEVYKMSRNKLSKRLLMLSAAITMMLCQSAFAAEEQVNAEVQAATEAPVVQMNMEEAMVRAFETNPAIKIAGYEKDAARGSLNAARAGRGITIKANASASRGGYDEVWYTKKQLLGNTERLGNTYSNSITASMPLYTGGALSGQIMSAKAGYKSALVGVQKSYNDMRSTVTNGYYTVLQADDMQVLARESVARLKEHLKNVKAQYDVGVVAKVDVLRSEVELANAQQNLIKAENAYKISEANFNKIIGMPLETNLFLEDTLNYVPYDKDLEYCLDYASKNRPELEQAKQGVQAARGQVRAARSGYQPQISAVASQNFGTSDAHWPADEESNWTVGVQASLTIFDTGVTRSKAHAAKANYFSAEESYRDTVDAVMLDVRSQYLNLREAEKRISTTEVAVSQAEEDYRIAQLRYQAGVGT
ncbi:MAG: TolC family protein, partial [Phascolarctobacterium sp.]|nr:TolC family protein [Phascolarctobacterium sp.]